MFRRERFFIVPIIAMMFCFGYADASAEEDGNLKQETESVITKDLFEKPQLVLYYASVACSCTMEHCRIALTVCDSMLAGDAAHIYRTIDVYIDSLAADSVAVWEVPVLELFDGTGRKKGRVEWDITPDYVHLLLQEGEKQ